MKYLKQLLIILGISFLGELLKYFLPLPIPASIYGMVILFALLLSGALPLSAVRETGNLLVAVMPVMFIPAGVGLMAVTSTSFAGLVAAFRCRDCNTGSVIFAL